MILVVARRLVLVRTLALKVANMMRYEGEGKEEGDKGCWVCVLDVLCLCVL